MKDIILKENTTTEEETLQHCLTAIQAYLDMDDFDQAYKYLNSFVSGIEKQTREETIREVESKVIDEKSLEDESNGRYNRELELREVFNKLKK